MGRKYQTHLVGDVGRRAGDRLTRRIWHGEKDREFMDWAHPNIVLFVTN
jgi:hypothetical protein